MARQKPNAKRKMQGGLIPQSVDDLLTKMAQVKTGGNRSQLIRDAIRATYKVVVTQEAESGRR